MKLNNSLRVLLAPEGDGNGGGGSLSPDQQKIVAAIEKQPSGPPEGVKAPITPKVVRQVVSAPPAKALEGDLDVGDDAPDDIKPEGDKKAAPKPEDKEADAAKKAADKAKADADFAAAAKAKKEADEKAAKEASDKAAKLDTKGQVKVTDAGKRDYTGFTEEETAVLKQMSNPAFELVAKQLKAFKELQNKKPDTYLQHPEAYTLSPEFTEVRNNHAYADFEARHWKQQLLNIRAGKPWQSIKGYDDKGQPVYDGPFKATDDAEIDVGNALNRATAAVGQFEQKLGEIKTSFKQRVDADVTNIKGEMAKRFEWESKPELLEQKIALPEIGEVSIKDIRADFKKMFAPHHQGNVLLDLAANMFVALQIYGSKINELQGGLGKEKELKSQMLEAEPVIEGGEAGGKCGKGGKDLVFDASDMP